MKNIFLICIVIGFLYIVLSTVAQISHLNASEAAKSLTKSGPFLDSNKVKKFVCGLKGE